MNDGAPRPTSDRALDLLRRLIAHPTVAGRSNLELIAEVAELLEAAGAAVNVVASVRPDARNLHAVLGPADAPGGILLAAHSDVVDVEGQSWTTDPFTLALDGDRAYGRGTADMKGFLAAALAVLTATDPQRLRRPVHLAVSSDEELGCVGVPPLLDALAALPVAPAWALVGEPTELQAVDRHKGKAAVRIHVSGRAAHSSVPGDGVNAVAHTGRLISGLVALGEELAAAGARDEAFRAPFSTVGIGPVRGGVAVNIVPDRCRLDVELRTVPAVDPGELMARVRALAAEVERAMRAEDAGCEIRLEELAAYPGLRPGVPDEFAEVVERAGAVGWGAVDFGTEAGLYRAALGIPVVVCGPGSMRDAHRADESIALQQLEWSTAMLGRLVAALTSDRPQRGSPGDGTPGRGGGGR